MRDTKRMIGEDLIFFQEEVASVLLIPEILGRSSGTGKQLGFTGRELEAGEEFRKTEELWDTERWVGDGQVWGVQGLGASILLGAVVP